MRFNIKGVEDARVAVFNSVPGENYYVYAPCAPDEKPYVNHKLPDQIPELSWLNKVNYILVDKPNHSDLDDWDHFFLVYSADCAFPPLYIVNAQNAPDALEIFCDGTSLTVIEPPDIDDYTDDELHHDNYGRAHDTSSIHIDPVNLTSIII